MGAAEHWRMVYFSHLLFQNLHAANHIFCQNTLSFHHKKKKKRIYYVIFLCCEKNLVFPQFCLVFGFTAGTYILFQNACNVYALFNGGAQVLYSFSGICHLRVQTP